MALEIQKGRSKWWYGRVTVDGKDITRNLGVEIKGVAPKTLREQGDVEFERSRVRAQMVLDKMQEDLKRRSTAEELVQTIHEIRTGERIRSLPLGEVMAKWEAMPRRKKPARAI